MKQKPVICIGSALVDELYHATSPLLLATTNIASVKRKAGGVSRNIAHQLALLDVPVQFITAFGNDSDGHWLKNECTTAGVKLDGSATVHEHTGKYTAIIDLDGSLFTAFVINTAEKFITAEYLATKEELLETASLIVADTNLKATTMGWLMLFCKSLNIPLVIEPVSVPPARKLNTMNLEGVYMITPNEDELPALCSEESNTTELQVQELFNRGVQKIWLHKGKDGSFMYSKEGMFHLPAPTATVVDCTGAGDGALSGWILASYLGLNAETCLHVAHTLAAVILAVDGAIAKNITREELLKKVQENYNDTSFITSNTTGDYSSN